MALEDFSLVQLSSSGPAVTVPGFGTPLILAADCPAGFTERVRTYTKPADMVTDGFTTTSGAYLQASKLCAQSPRPPKFKVGRLANIPSQHFTLTPSAQNSTKYGMTLNGSHITTTSDGTATAAEIVTALTTLINALAISGLTVSGTTTLILSMAAGKFLSVGVDDTTLMKVVEDTTDAGVAADLNAILLEDKDWYCLLGQFNSAAMVAARGAWAETNKKLHPQQVVDSDAENTAPSGATDVAAVSKASALYYTNPWYSRNTGDFLDAAIAGLKLTSTPGSEIWGLTSLASVTATKLTATQRSNLVGKNCNFLEANVGGIAVTAQGMASSGEWIDVVRFKDWQVADMEAAVFNVLHAAAQTNSKMPFTNAGIKLIAGTMRASLKRGQDANGLSKDTDPVIVVPLVTSVSPSDKSARALTTITFSATLAGAIQSATINGTLTY